MVIKMIMHYFEITSILKLIFVKCRYYKSEWSRYSIFLGIIKVNEVDKSIFFKCFNCSRMKISFKYLEK